MNYAVYLLTWFFFLISGCGITEKEAPPEFESYFRAEINGDAWSGDAPRAGFTYIEQDTLFQVFASRYDTLLFPYRDKLSIGVYLEKKKNEYSVILESNKHNKMTGALYSELDGDAVIAWYYPEQASVNSFTVEFGTDEEGREFAKGTFAMKVVVDPNYDKPNNNQYRQRPDTVLITNGTYKVLLER